MVNKTISTCFRVQVRCLLLAAMAFVFDARIMAQSLHDNFEGQGNINTWYGDNCGFQVLPNPVSGGINTSATVAEYHDVGGTYANLRFDAGRKLNMATAHVFSFKIYVPSPGLSGNQNNQVSLKLQDGTLPAPWSTQSEIIKTIQLDQWQVLRFDFAHDPYVNLDPASAAPIARSDFDRVVIQVNGENNNDQVKAFIDDFLYLDTAQTAPSSVFTKLVWSDEFNGNGAIDTAKWFHQTKLPAGGSWFNGEIQHYTDRLDNASVTNGNLNLIAKKEQYTSQGHTKQYTSARLNAKFAFTYGRVEVRAKLPRGAGTWPGHLDVGKKHKRSGSLLANPGLRNHCLAGLRRNGHHGALGCQSELCEQRHPHTFQLWRYGKSWRPNNCNGF